MICLVEMPDPASASLGKLSKFLVSRGQSVPSDMKRELAALGAPRQLERSPGAVTRTPQKVINNLNPNGSRNSSLPSDNQIKDDVIRVFRSQEPKFMNKDRAISLIVDDIEKVKMGVSPQYLPRTEVSKYIQENKTKSTNDPSSNVLDIKAKTVDKSVAPLTASGGTRYARGDAQDFDKDLSSGKLQRVGDKSYFGWTDSYGSGAKAVGEGSYGTVIKNKDGTFVKRGAISDTEAGLIKELGKKDLGPKLVAADINGKHSWHNEDFVDIRNGRIAMTQVAGTPMGERTGPSDEFGGKKAADVYWKALGDLHRLGIAHNDAHIENIMVDDNGKGRWVDLGLAQKNPKAAFAEAYGAFSPGARKEYSKAGNWQTPRWDATGIKEWSKEESFRPGSGEFFQWKYPVFGRVLANQSKVADELRQMGFSKGEIAQIQNTSIRSPLNVYEEGPWAKLNNAQAQKLINTLYDGI
jgi:hypothetical protein